MENEVERLDRVVDTLHSALDEAFRLFALPKGRLGDGWGYDLRSDQLLEEPESSSTYTDDAAKIVGSGSSVEGPSNVTYAENGFSQGTTAMVLCAILATMGGLGRSVASPFGGLRDAEWRGHLARSYLDAKNGDAPQIDLPEIMRALVANVVNKKVRSSTFGENDPLTLTWLLELLNATGQTSDVHSKLEEMRQTLAEAAADVEGRGAGWYAPTDGGSKRFKFEAVADNPFPLLRVEHVRELSERTKADNASETTAPARPVRRRAKDHGSFERKFLQHVAYSTMEDSRFDPAELTFAFEGMLQVGLQPDGDMVARFLSIMEEAQISSAYWRPVNPILAAPNGTVLHPVSVETALSLLRCCAILDAEPRSVGITTRIVPMLERYWAWLLSRKTTIDVEERTFAGWHSEHVNQRGTIHMWETSQVVLFIVGFRELIGRYVGRMGAKAARLDVDTTRIVVGSSAATRTKKWRDAITKYEPVSALGRPYEVYARLDEAMVTPRLLHQTVPSDGYSALLFGPPGTGKTTIARNVAEALNWPFVNVTVSDFLAEGADVEARAKAIFEVLKRQQDVVVLFDEIDQLLLDRDSKIYQQQDSVVQLLTPGMLPKLQQLRDAKNCIFFVATNYVDRIDPAIKRRGRIDHRIAVLPMDAESRRKIIEGYVGDLLGPRDGTSWNDKLRRAVEASFLLGFNDIRAVIDEATRDSAKGGTVDVVESLANASRSMTMNGYRTRIGPVMEKPQLPFEEVMLMTALALAEEAGEGTVPYREHMSGLEFVDEAAKNGRTVDPYSVLPRHTDEAVAVGKVRDLLHRNVASE